MTKVLYIAMAGSLGALARYFVVSLFMTLVESSFPYGTLIINTAGSFLLGFIGTLGTERYIMEPGLRAAITIGFIGAFTTFSTFTYETWHLLEDGSFGLAALNIFTSVAAGMLAVWVGAVLARIF